MKEYKYYIQKTFKASADVLILELGDIRGLPVFDFKPGQYVMIYYKNAKGRLEQKHTFSIASSPLEKGCVRLGIKIGGQFTRGLAGLKIGDEIFVQGPYGNFVFDENKYSDLVMIAGGIGITPFISTLYYAAHKGLANRLSLIYSNKTIGNTAFYNEIRSLETKNNNFRALFAVTDEKNPLPKEGVVYSRINANMINDFVGSVYGKTFFLCGPGLFMAAAKDHLFELGADRSQIQMEDFTMAAHMFWPGLKNISYATAVSAAVLLVTFNLVNKPVSSVSAPVNKEYDSTVINNINKAVSDRLSTITNAKDKAIADLKQNQQKSANAATPAKQTISTKQSRTVNNSPTIQKSARSQNQNTPAPTPSTPAVSVPTQQISQTQQTAQQISQPTQTQPVATQQPMPASQPMPRTTMS
jgi:ferredoxin-NADP reductase